MNKHNEKLPMNFEKLKSTYPHLLTYMEEAGYSEIYVKGIHKEILRILAERDRHGWNDYLDIRKYYEQTSNTHGNYRRKRAYLGVIMEFDLYGKLPDGRTPR